MLVGLTVAFGVIAIVNNIQEHSPRTKLKVLKAQEQNKKRAEAYIQRVLDEDRLEWERLESLRVEEEK